MVRSSEERWHEGHTNQTSSKYTDGGSVNWKATSRTDTVGSQAVLPGLVVLPGTRGDSGVV